MRLDLPERLGCIGVYEAAVTPPDLDHSVEVLEYTGLVVGEHH